MATASLNLKLDYKQVLELAKQLSDEDKLRLKDELISESNKTKLQYFQNLFSCEESELLTMDEIQAEVNELRRERYEARRKDKSHC
jgi:hypothetical protein